MLVPGRLPGGRVLTAAALSALVVVASCSGDDDTTDDTLQVIDPTGSVPTATVPTPGTGVSPGTVAAGDVGSGFVSISVQIASQGIAETISLDRSTVAQASLDPVTLDAMCTPLDGGDPAAGVEVSVVDLRRLAGDRVVSAVLRFGESAPGEHDMTLELGSADQVTTTYSGSVTVDEGGMTGAFEGADPGGTAVSGSFACATQAIATTTTAPLLDAGEEVPDDPATAASTATS